MARIHLVSVVGMILIALILAYSQAPVRKQPVQVTAQSLSRQPAGKPYVIDLTRNGKTYSVTADVVSRLRIRTANGETAMTDLMSKLGVTTGKFRTGSKFLVGRQSDVSAIKFGRASVARTSATATAKGLDCGLIICECDPDIEGDCDGRKFFCTGPMICWQCDGPDCPPERRGRWICACIHI